MKLSDTTLEHLASYLGEQFETFSISVSDNEVKISVPYPYQATIEPIDWKNRKSLLRALAFLVMFLYSVSTTAVLLGVK